MRFVSALMKPYSVVAPLIGGMLIGFASLVATAISRKIPGISGVVGRLLVSNTPDKLWRVIFLIGLIGGAVLTFTLWRNAAVFRPMRPLPLLAVAGLLVGFGTRLSGGCTSGHGVCGVGMGAKDSIVATAIFVTTGVITVFIYNRAIG